MTDTSGPTSFPLFVNASLQSYLVNRLQQRLATVGSIICRLTWKPKVTPRGWPYYQLVASTPLIEETGFGLLPTPSGTSNHGKNHVAGRLDEWGGSTNPFRGTELGRVHCPSFELWMMGYPEAWREQMPQGMPSSRRSQQKS